MGGSEKATWESCCIYIWKWVWLKIKQGGGLRRFGPCFHLPGFHFGTGFLSHSQMNSDMSIRHCDLPCAIEKSGHLHKGQGETCLGLWNPLVPHRFYQGGIYHYASGVSILPDDLSVAESETLPMPEARSRWRRDVANDCAKFLMPFAEMKIC